MATALHPRAARAPNGRHNGKTSTRQLSLAQGLGWASIGLGVAELVAPGRVARLVGADDSSGTRTTVRAMGAREMMAGVGILSQRRQSEWLWGRVAGDLLDLALLAAVLRVARGERNRTVGAIVAIAGITVLDAVVARTRSRDRHREAGHALQDDAPPPRHERDGLRTVRASITINRPIEEVTRGWGEAQGRLPHSPCLPDADIAFDAGPRLGETEVHVSLSYAPHSPVVRLAKTLKRDTPEQLLQQELRHIKQLLEVGEIVHSDSSIHRGVHAAQPEERVS